ncbi:MAG: 2-amino-4-hydroxy-6-hydroxymethyldihydropteridine diphosphokinase [Pseudomonadota bacterium]
MAIVYVSVGSNLDREHSIHGGMRQLNARFGALVVSPVYESAAHGFSGPAFLNLVVGFDTALGVGAVDAALDEVERDCGRSQASRGFNSRTLDLDLLLHGDLVGNVDGVELPRDEIDRYAFVLRPLADVAGNQLHPVRFARYADLWDAFDQSAQPLIEFPMDLEIYRHPVAMAARAGQ